MKNYKIKFIAILAFMVFYGCSTEEDWLNDYEVEITLSGDVEEFIQLLFINAARNDGEGNFNAEQLLFKDSGSLAPSAFTDEDLDQKTYRFITNRPAGVLEIIYTNQIKGSSNNAKMDITVVVKRDGTQIDNFTIEYDQSTGKENFSVKYNSNNNLFKCYCDENCRLLISGFCD